jgi:hypothetical protein
MTHVLLYASHRHNIRLLAASLFFCLCTFSSRAQKVFDFNNECRTAYKEILSLKLQSGQKMLDAEKQKHPDNLVPLLLENYIDFFVLFFNEDPKEYEKRFPNRDQRLQIFDQGPADSPFFLYSKAVVHFQWAAIRIKFGYRWDAGWEFRRSFLQTKENLNNFPSFSPNKLYHGAMQVTVGTIPDGYKWLSNLLGMKGNIKEGMKSVEQFVRGNDEWENLFHDEAIFYYCYLQFYIQNNKEGVAKFIKNQKLDLVNNHLFAYLASNLALNNQDSERAEEILEKLNRSEAYLPTAVWDLEMGYVKLHKLQPDAVQYFDRFLKTFKGKFYVKDALQKLSWHYYLAGDQSKADWYRSEILKRGNTETEADKQAQKEAKTGRWPNKILLQARLLNDGGYFKEALRLLHGKAVSDFQAVEDQLELSYRVGRLYDDMGADTAAIPFYKEAIRLGEFRKEYFAARAALQLGMLYEGKGDKVTAMGWYERCMKMPDHDYKNSLDQRAKAGVARCKGN